MSRKTVDVEVVKGTANRMLAHVAKPEGTVSEQVRQAEDAAEQRKGVITLLESVLFETDNYRGFRYLPSEKDLNGSLLPDYDDTRREYI